MNIWNLVLGVASIIIGIIIIIIFSKNNNSKVKNTKKQMIQGYIGVFWFIILGIILIANELKIIFD